MSVVRVNPESVRAYAVFAQERFDAIRAELEALTRDVVGVRYFGPNAATFKTECGRIASEFSTALLADLGQIAEAVSASTSNIAASLGGTPIRLSVNGAAVAIPAVDAGDGTVDVDTSALDALKPVVTARFGALEDALASHLSRLESTDWEGSAKQTAVGEVSRFTGTARSRSQEAQAAINSTVDRQVSAVLAADR